MAWFLEKDGQRFAVSKETAIAIGANNGSLVPLVIGEEHHKAFSEIRFALWPHLCLLSEKSRADTDTESWKLWTDWTELPVPASHEAWKAVWYFASLTPPDEITDQRITSELKPALLGKHRRDTQDKRRRQDELDIANKRADAANKLSSPTVLTTVGEPTDAIGTQDELSPALAAVRGAYELVSAPDVEAAPADNGCKKPSMRRLKKGWRIEFEDEARDVDLLGFDFIAKLVNEAGQEVSTSRLLGIEDDPRFTSDRHGKQDRWDGETRADVMDRIRELEAKIARLNSECEDAEKAGDELAFDESNQARSEAAKELQQLRAHKREAINKDGRSRELNRPLSKDHDNVRKRIDAARDHLKAKGLVKLHQHFVDFIQPDGKGTAYIYKPVPKVEWIVIFVVG